MRGEAQVPPGDIHELRVAPRRPHRGHMAQREEGYPCDPQLQTEPDSSCKCRIGNREPARRTAQQDMLGQCPVDGNGEAWRQSS